MSQLQCIVVTPERTVQDEPASFVAVPLYDGEIGLAPGHSPMIGRLGYGELRIVTSAGTERYYVDGGFVQVSNDVVSVLTNRAIPATQVDPLAAEQQLREAQAKPGHTPELQAIRDRQQLQARAMLRVAGRAK